MNKQLKELVETGKNRSAKSETTSNYGDNWSKAKKIRLCGIIYGERLNSEGQMVPKRAWCKQPECERCMSYRGKKIATEIHGALGEAMRTNPKLKVYKRIILDNGGKAIDAFTKRIRYHNGLYKRVPLEDGVFAIITVIPDVYHPDKMAKVFGNEIKPRLTDDTYFTFSDTLNVDYKEIAMYCKLSGRRVTGTLRKNSAESDNIFLLRLDTYVPKDAAHMAKKRELDASFQMTMNDDLENNDGLQSELDNDRKARVAYYLDNDLDFSVIPDFIMVPESEFEKWNTAAKLQNLFSPNKRLCSNGYEKEHNRLLGEKVRFDFREGEAKLVID